MEGVSAQHYRIEVLPEHTSFDCERGANLLVGMERKRVGVSMLQCIPVGCRGGGCGVCRIRILEGEYDCKKMSIKHVTPEERERGVALACRVFPTADMRIEVLGDSAANSP